MRFTRLSLLTSACVAPVALMLCAPQSASAQSITVNNPSFETQTVPSNPGYIYQTSTGQQVITSWNITSDWQTQYLASHPYTSSSIAGLSLMGSMTGGNGHNYAYLGNGQSSDLGGDVLNQSLTGALSTIKAGTYELKVLVGNNGVQPAGNLLIGFYGSKTTQSGSVYTTTVYSSAQTKNSIPPTTASSIVNSVHVNNASTVIDETKIASGTFVLEDFVYTVHAGDAIIGSTLGVTFNNETAGKISLLDNVQVIYAVPEPGTYAMLAGMVVAAGGMFVRRRRK